MSKFRSLILIIGLTVIAVAAALLTVLVLYATGTIVTDPIELVYTVGSKSKYYDGTPLTLADDDYSLVSGSVLEGHTAQVKIIGSQTNAGESESTLEVKILDKNGFDVSGEYAVKVNTGTLTVEKQILSVSVKSDEVYYSGKEIVFNKYEVTGGELARGHKLGGVSGTLLNAGESLPKNVAPVVYDAFDNDVTANYDFGGFNIGDVTVVARPLTVKPKNVTKVYDGIPFTAYEYEITEGSLAPGHEIECTITNMGGDVATFTDCTGSNGERIRIDSFKIVDENGKEVENWEKNYDYSTGDAGLVTIEQRPLTIKTASETFIYDGEAHYNDTYQIFYGTLAPGQKLTITEPTKVTTVQQGVLNKVSCVITLDDDDGSTVDGNYDITYIEGTLSVKPFDLTVYTKSYTRVYDKDKTLGDAMDDDNYWLSVKLPEKFTLTAECPDTIKALVDAVEETYYKLQNITITTEGENGVIDCTGNFNINVVDGTYSITKQPVKLSASTTLKSTYDGEAYTFDNDEVFAGVNFSDYDFTAANFTVDGYYEIKDVGKHYYTAEFTGSSDNYDVTVENGVVEIEKMSVTLNFTGELVMNYSGAFGYYDKDEDIIDGLSVGEIGTVEAAVFSKNKIEEITVKSVTVYKDGKDITSNLEIDYESLKIPVTINKIAFTLKPAPFSGTSIDGVDFSSLVTATGLVGGDYVKVTTWDDGYSEYGVEFYTVYDSKGEDVTDKYYECTNPNATGVINLIYIDY